MIWTIEEVVSTLSGDLATPGDDKSVSLPIFDKKTGIGLGVDGAGALALVLPGIENQSAFETKAMKFDPWCETTWMEGGVELPRSAVLRCNLDRADKQVLRLVIGVLLSVVDLQVRFNNAGLAIWKLKELFGDGFKVSIQLSTIRGLIGELLLILGSRELVLAVSAWHIDADDRYDFSFNNTRVEVKTTSSSVRQHRFTSRQLPALHGIDAWVASVQLAEVAVGETIGGLFDRIANQLPMDSARKLSEVVIETLGVPASALSGPQFDLEASLRSILMVPGRLVPTPEAVPGTSDLKWSAYISDSDGLGLDKLNQLLTENGDNSLNPKQH
jgi:hypothetical protein